MVFIVFSRPLWKAGNADQASRISSSEKGFNLFGSNYPFAEDFRRRYRYIDNRGPIPSSKSTCVQHKADPLPDFLIEFVRLYTTAPS
jgi:hypothetical protein